MTFGQKLRLLLKENNMSQEDLAEQLNVSRQAAGKWVNDKGLPEVGKLIQISDLFGVSMDYLLKEDFEEKHESNPEKQMKDPEKSRAETCGTFPAQSNGYYVSQEMLGGYLAYSRQSILQLTAGLALFVLSDLFESLGYHNSVTALLHWLSATAGIVLIIWYFSGPRQYQEIKRNHLVFDGSVLEEFRQKSETRRRYYAAVMSAGVVILLASSEAEYFLMTHFEHTVCSVFCALSDTVCLTLIVWARMSMYTDSLIIKNASSEPRRASSRRCRWIYAALPVTACGVMIGLATNAWSPYAPILILFCCLLVTACRLLIERRENNE